MTDPLVAALVGGFSLGLFGSLHCIGMCGGIVSAMGQAGGGDAAHPRSIAIDAIPYHAGRIGSYAFMGALAGALGAAFALGAEARFALRMLASALLIAAGLYVAGWWLGLSQLERAFSPLWRRLSPLTSRLLPAETVGRRLALGALWGWLPCGLVYSALVLAAAASDAATGALTMAAFGVGTAPSLLAVGAFGRMLTGLSRKVSVRRGAGIALCLFGLWTAVGPTVMHAVHGGGHGDGQHPAAHSMDDAAGHAGHAENTGETEPAPAAEPAADPHAHH